MSATKSPLVAIPGSMAEVASLITDMRGTQSDLTRVAIMAHQVGRNEAAVEQLKSFQNGNSSEVEHVSRAYKLARRAVTCARWRWVPGMIDTSGHRFIRGDSEGRVWLWHKHGQGGVEPALTYVPDLTDPATMGCLLALVREAWSDPSLAACRNMDELTWQIDPTVTDRTGTSEAEALVCALEAAP